MDQSSLSVDSITPDESVSMANEGVTPKPDKKRTSTCWYFFFIPKKSENTPEKLKCFLCSAMVIIAN